VVEGTLKATQGTGSPAMNMKQLLANSFLRIQVCGRKQGARLAGTARH
jgi:hypothetical protein